MKPVTTSKIVVQKEMRYLRLPEITRFCASKRYNFDLNGIYMFHRIMHSDTSYVPTNVAKEKLSKIAVKNNERFCIPFIVRY